MIDRILYLYEEDRPVSVYAQLQKVRMTTVDDVCRVTFPRVLSLLNQSGFEGPYVIEREISDAATAQKIGETLQRLKQMLK